MTNYIISPKHCRIWKNISIFPTVIDCHGVGDHFSPAAEVHLPSTQTLRPQHGGAAPSSIIIQWCFDKTRLKHHFGKSGKIFSFLLFPFSLPKAPASLCGGCTRRPRDGVCTLLYVPYTAFDVAKILFEFRNDDVITEYKLITYLRLSPRPPAALQATSEHEKCFIFKDSCLLHALH